MEPVTAVTDAWEPFFTAQSAAAAALAGPVFVGLSLNLRTLGKEQPAGQFMANLLLFECAVWPYVVGGVLLMVGNLSALYWIAGAIILSFIKALVDAWVLLVEINR
jgi:hypothetical protein